MDSDWSFYLVFFVLVRSRRGETGATTELLKPAGTNWRADSLRLLDLRPRHRRSRGRRLRGRLRIQHPVPRRRERPCPVSGPLTWILCGNQDLLLKHGTARERRKERTNGESDRATRGETKTSREEDGEGEDSLLLVRHRSVVPRGAQSALPRGFSDRDRSTTATRTDQSGSNMISLRATRPGSLRPPHCGREFCPVCR
jgi:hypothetical protein